MEQLQSALAREQTRAAARQAELDKAWHETSEAQDKLQQNDKALTELKSKLEISTYASKSKTAPPPPPLAGGMLYSNNSKHVGI